MANDNLIAQQIGALAQAFQQAFPRISGTVTLSAAATTVVSNTSVTANSIIDILNPGNAAAATLIGSAKCPYVSARSAGVSFTISTANGAAAAGTEVLTYTIQNPV